MLAHTGHVQNMPFNCQQISVVILPACQHVDFYLSGFVHRQQILKQQEYWQQGMQVNNKVSIVLGVTLLVVLSA